VKDKVNVTLKELAQALTGLFAPEADVPALAISSFAA
jgi:hypothetical protein